MRAPSIVGAAFLAAVACQQEESHPEFASRDCAGPTCAPDSRRGGGSGVQGSGGTGGAGGGSSVGDAGTHAMAGDVFVFVDALFEAALPFGGQGTIGITDGITRVATTISNSAFSLDGVPDSPVLWVDLVQAPGADDTLPTLFAIDGTATLVEVAFADRAVIEGILSTLRSDLAPSATRAELVVTFVDPVGVPVAGVEVTQHSGAIVGYDDGAGFSNVGFTQGRGTVFIANAAAAPLPGGLTSFSYRDVNGTTGSVSLRAAQGAVSFATVQL